MARVMRSRTPDRISRQSLIAERHGALSIVSSFIIQQAPPYFCIQRVFYGGDFVR